MKQDLQKKVERMLNEEQKRREVAIKWLQEITEILSKVAPDIWGDGEQNPFELEENSGIKAVFLGKQHLYFRYGAYRFRENKSFEDTGFYYGTIGWDGKNVIDLRGSEFWWAIRTILEWIPDVLELMEEKEISREELLEKIVRKEG